jgi:UDP-N-acetylmuramate-alanine ligase
MSKTVIIHEINGRNDITTDTGWDYICVAVALDHESFEVVGSDVATSVLRDRMEANGYRVLHEDDEFVYQNAWVRKGSREAAVKEVVVNIDNGNIATAATAVYERKDDPMFVLDVLAEMERHGWEADKARNWLARILNGRQ